MFGKKRKEEQFFDLFTASTELVCKAARVLEEVMQQPSSLAEKTRNLIDIEHEADGITTSIIDSLNRTLITPMDREDIYTLAQSLDDIIDFVMGAADRMQLYRVSTPVPASHDLVKLLVQCTDEINKSFKLIRNVRGNREQILAAAARLNNLESEGDKVYRYAVARLFEEEKDPIVIIKWKEILERLETALDFCEDIGDLLKGAVLKYA